MGADAIQLAVPFWMEVDDRDVVKFYRDVVSVCPDLTMTIYDILRSKKHLTADMHRAIAEATGTYMAVKCGSGTVGITPEGCAQLSEFVNVWVGEGNWSELGPAGAIGAASALVYMNPRVILDMFRLLRQKKWDELAKVHHLVHRLHTEGRAPFTARGFTDTEYDHLLGRVAGFLKLHPRSRGPYVSATEEDIEELHTWMERNVPELLRLS